MAGAPAPIDGVFDADPQDSRSAAHARPASGRRQSAEGAGGSRAARSASRVAAGCGEPAVAGQHARHADCRSTSRAASARTRHASSRRCIKARSSRRAARASKAAIPSAPATTCRLSDFAEVFGSGGLYDKFFNDNLEKLVDTSQRPWSWRPDSVASSPGMLAQFERVERIRQMFFTAGIEGAEAGVHRQALEARSDRDAVLRLHRRPVVRREARRGEPVAGGVARRRKGGRRLRHVRGPHRCARASARVRGPLGVVSHDRCGHGAAADCRMPCRS